jgi:hypothetical protein
MVQSRRDNYRVLPQLSGKKRAIALLVFAVTGILIALGPPHVPVLAQDRTIPAQTGTSYATVAANGYLNLTNASVNESSNFLENPWSINTTTAQVIINSTDTRAENVTAVWSIDPIPLVSAQIIEYNFEFSTQVAKNGSSGPKLTATVELASSEYEGWNAQSGTPIFPNNTETVSVANIQGQYSNGSSRTSLVFEAQRVTNAQPTAPAGTSTVLVQQEFPGYAAGDGVLHQYTIEIDRQSNRTIWIADNSIIATYDLSLLPSSLVFEASAGPQNLAIATLKDPVQIAVPSIVESIVTTSSGGQSPSASSPSAGQSSISSLQNQIDHLNGQVGNLTSQNSQLQAKTSQWFTQWWAGIIWGGLGAGLGGFLFVSGTRLKTGGNGSDTADDESSCPECGGRMPAEAAFCGECGNVLKDTKPVCPECGEQMPAASTFCGDCGTQMTAKDQPPRNLPDSSPSQAPTEKDRSWR